MRAMSPKTKTQVKSQTQNVFLSTLQKLEQLRESAVKSEQWINVPIVEVNHNGVIMRLQLAISPSGVPMLQLTGAKVTNKINLPSTKHLEAIIQLLNAYYSNIAEEKRQAIAEFLAKYTRRRQTVSIQI